MPASVAAGDLLVIIGSGVTATTFALTGWTQLMDENVNRGILVYVRQADGTEGADETVTSVGSVKPAFIAYRITGAADPGVTAPTSGTTATGTSVNPNPPNCNPGVGRLSLHRLLHAGR